MSEAENIIPLSLMEQRRIERFDRKSTALAEKMLRRVRAEIGSEKTELALNMLYENR